MFVVKVFCGGEPAEIIPPFETRQIAIDWVHSNAWRRFEGDADRAELYDVGTYNRAEALELARHNAGDLIWSQSRPLAEDD